MGDWRACKAKTLSMRWEMQTISSENERGKWALESRGFPITYKVHNSGALGDVGLNNTAPNAKNSLELNKAKQLTWGQTWLWYWCRTDNTHFPGTTRQSQVSAQTWKSESKKTLVKIILAPTTELRGIWRVDWNRYEDQGSSPLAMSTIRFQANSFI